MLKLTLCDFSAKLSDVTATDSVCQKYTSLEMVSHLVRVPALAIKTRTTGIPVECQESESIKRVMSSLCDPYDKLLNKILA